MFVIISLNFKSNLNILDRELFGIYYLLLYMVSKKFYVSKILLNLQIIIIWSVFKIILDKFGKEIVWYWGFSFYDFINRKCLKYKCLIIIYPTDVTFLWRKGLENEAGASNVIQMTNCSKKTTNIIDPSLFLSYLSGETRWGHVLRSQNKHSISFTFLDEIYYLNDC